LRIQREAIGLPDLNPKQKRFVAEYLIDGNATQAAIRAGYSAKTAAQGAAQLLSNIKVRAAVDAAQAKINGKLEITAEKVLRDLEEARAGALKDGQFSAAIRASELQGKSLPGGMFTDASHTKTENVTPRSQLDRARRIAFLLARAQRAAQQAQAIPATPQSNKALNNLEQ
jgi:phage terminase small subunit